MIKEEFVEHQHEKMKEIIKQIDEFEIDSNLVEHARQELQCLIESDDEMDKQMAKNIIRLVKVFAAEGHSGFSAQIAIGTLKKLLKFEPLGELTGEDHEWSVVDFGDEIYAQNIRDGRVFMRKDGSCYFVEGVKFKEPDGSTYTGEGSAVEVQFPFIPEPMVLNVDYSGNPETGIFYKEGD